MPYSLEVAWCRIFQSVLKIGNYLMGCRMPECLEGPGKCRELGTFLKENGIRYAVQTYDTTDPTSDDVELRYRTYREIGPA